MNAFSENFSFRPRGVAVSQHGRGGFNHSMDGQAVPPPHANARLFELASPRSSSPSAALRPGPRPLFGVHEFDILKRQAKITALAAAHTRNELDKINHTRELPKPEKVRLGAKNAHQPQAALLQPPPKANPRRRGVNWQAVVLTEAAFCFEDVAEADLLLGGEDAVGTQEASAAERESQLRLKLAEAESVFGSTSTQLAPMLCSLGCAVVRQAVVAESGELTRAAEEAEALGSRAVGLLTTGTTSGTHAPKPGAKDVAPTVAGLAELGFVLEAYGEHPSAVRMQRLRLEIARGRLEADALRRAAIASDLAQALLRSAAKPDPRLVSELVKLVSPPLQPEIDLAKASSARPTAAPPQTPEPFASRRGSQDSVLGAAGLALASGEHIGARPGTPTPSPGWVRSGTPERPGSAHRPREAQPRSPFTIRHERISGEFESLSVSPAGRRPGSSMGSSHVASRRPSGHQPSCSPSRNASLAGRALDHDAGEYAAEYGPPDASKHESGWIPALRPRQAQLPAPPEDQEASVWTPPLPDAAAMLIQRRVRRRTGLRYGLSTWLHNQAERTAKREKAALRRERADAMQLMRDGLLTDALKAFDEAEAVLSLHEMLDEPRPIANGAREREDGTLRLDELRRRILAGRAEAFEGMGSLPEALAALEELADLQHDAMLGAREVAVTLAKMVDLIRRTRPRSEAALPLKKLLAAERSLLRPLTEGGIRLPKGASAAAQAGDVSTDPRLLWCSMADVVAAELLELYTAEGMMKEALQLMFSAGSPVPRSQQDLLEKVVKDLQRSLRKRRRAASIIAAADRARRDRTHVRRLRVMWRAATRIEAHVRGRKCRGRLKSEAEERRLDTAARVLQARQRSRVEARKPQWPMRLMLMAARAEKRRQSSIPDASRRNTTRDRIERRSIAPDKLNASAVVVTQRLSMMVTSSGENRRGSSRAWDPRGGE